MRPGWQPLLIFGFLSVNISVRAAENPSLTPDSAGFARIAQPFFKEHCLRCHGPEKQKGDFRVDTQLPNTFLDPAAKEKWGEVVNALNGHEMPPKKEPQPNSADVSKIVDWITSQMVRAELVKRDAAIVLRRLNRDEYRNTIRDLVGLDYDVSAFPLDPASGGFDNNGRALTISPMHTELYVETARRILDRALVEGVQPRVVKWRFQPEEGEGDDHRIQLEGNQRPIVHGAKNEKRGAFTVMHHNSWDRVPNARDFSVPSEGEYIIRVRAGGRVPDRAEVVASAKKALQSRLDKQMQENAKGERWHKEAFTNDLKHFETDRMYDYGPPRLRLIQDLGGQPKVIAEWDVDAPLSAPKVYEFRARFTTEKTGLRLEYAYSIPSVLENFWFQNHDVFARPEAHLDWFEIEGPAYASWPPPSHQKLLPDLPLAQSDERAYAREVLARFMRQAYRRPVKAEEIAGKLALFDRARKEKSAFVAAIKTPLIAVLASPHFIYLVEPDPAPKTSSQPRPLTDHELATRLSYFLWSTMPDEELAHLADAGRLHSPATLEAQVKRLLKHPKSEQFVRNFAGQWLGLREVGANPPAPDLYPQYDRHLEMSIVGESEAFFAEILRTDRSVLNFIKSDFVTINERLARFYGITGVRGDPFRRVAAPPAAHRGGVMTQASILSLTSNGTRTSPVKRGTWLLKNILGTDPGLPVANVGDIAPKVPGIDKATVRKRLEIHRELPQCARCHDKIDPLGFALENFNAAGEWRAQEGFGYKGRIDRNDPVIDASGQMPDGSSFKTMEEMQSVLLKQEDLFLKCLAGKMFTYALGRELGIVDQPTVKDAAEQMKKHGYTLRSLVQYVATSKAFLTK
jgi:mono/diheme cytochrome c family protein